MEQYRVLADLFYDVGIVGGSWFVVLAIYNGVLGIPDGFDYEKENRELRRDRARTYLKWAVALFILAGSWR